MQPSEPLVTVIALCFNHERFVVECLESIRAQTFRQFQLIISDDASTDRSKTLIRQWIATHNVDCIFVDHEINIGVVRTYNEVFGLSKGRYVCVIATDDLWMPEKLERQLSVMQQASEDVAVLYGDVEQIDESGATLPNMFLAHYGVEGSAPEGDVARRMVEGNFIPALSTMIRRQAVLDVGGYDERLNYEDWDMWVRLALRYRFAYYDYVGAKYRIVSNSLSRTTARGDHPQTIWSDVQTLLKVIRTSCAERNLRYSAIWQLKICAERLLKQGDRRGWLVVLMSTWWRGRLKLERIMRTP